MTAQLRARAVQAGALLALVGGMLAVASSPAAADDPNVQVTNQQSRDVNSGGQTSVTFSVTNKNNNPTLFDMNVQTNNGFTCNDGCSPSTLIQGNQTLNFEVKLTAPTVAAGQNQTLQVVFVATSRLQQNDSASANAQFTVHGAAAVQTVRQVTGRVKDQNGKAVSGADVGMRDSQNHTFTGTTNDEGRFQFTSSDANPIVPGALTVGANKTNYKQVTVNVQGAAGKVVTVNLTLAAVEASPTASPSATETAAAPTAAADPGITDGATLPPATNSQNTAGDSKGNSMLYIILGALLVAAGVGAIVLLVMRRRNKKDDGGDPDDFGGPVGGGPVPGSQGRYNGLPDATRVAAPIGAGVNDATRVARQQSIADAPTMMQPAVPADDEFPDPYGAPAVPGGGYAGTAGYGQTGQYGGGAYGGTRVPAQSGGYDAGPPTQFGPESPDDAYGGYAPQGGYGPGGQPRYDEPTGMYRPGFDDGGYQQPAAPAEDYGQAPGYGGSWGAPAGGIDNGNGYGPAAGGGYGGPPAQYGQQPPPAPYADEQYADEQQPQYGGGQYGAGGGQYGGGNYGAAPEPENYDQGGYDQRGGYGRGESYDDQGGYDQRGTYGGARAAGGGPYGGGAPAAGDQGGYYGAEQGGGRHGGQSRPPAEQPQQPPPSRPGQRRNIDWLDD